MAGRANLDGRVALVTGASAGIGRAIASTLSDSGATVVGLDLNETPHDGGKHFDTVVDSGGLVVGDVSDPDDVDEALDVAADYGDLHVVVNNAGIAGHGRIDESTLDEWRRSFRVHVEGTFHVCQRALPEMADRGAGSVVNLSSIAALGGYEGAADYSAAKGALTSLTRQLAADFSPSGVRVNAVAPGFIKTEMNAERWRDNDDFPDDSPSMQRTLLPFAGEPEDIAGMVDFLASDTARFITGQVIPVDGGWTI